MNGFYRKFKERAREALKDVDFHQPTQHSKQIADIMVVLTIFTAILSSVYKSSIIIVASGKYFLILLANK